VNTTVTTTVTLNQHRPFEVELAFKVKTYDVDFVQLVHNSVYIRWLEDLRQVLLEAHWPLEQQMGQGYGPVLLQTHIEYKRGIRLFDQPRGRMWVSDLGPLRWTVEADITIGDTIAATARQVGCFVSLSTGQPVRMPRELVEKYRTFVKE
jgi:acyl-CoA thioester hydrolase